MEPDRNHVIDLPTLIFDAENQLVNVEGTHRLHWVEWGDEQNSDVLICVHGLTRNGRDFDFLAQGLADRYRVICPDIPGRGQSDWLPDPGLYGYPLYVADMLALLSHVGASQVDWVGTSMGGLIGMFVAASQPQLIRKLVMNDIGPYIPSDAMQRLAEYVGVGTSAPSRDVLERRLRDAMATFNVTRETFWQHLFEHSIQPDEKGGFRLAYDPTINAVFRDDKGQVKPQESIDLWSVWSVLQQESLIIRGEESDLLTPETLSQMHAMRDHVQSVLIPRTGHAPMLMTKAEITLVRGWLLESKLPKTL